MKKAISILAVVVCLTFIAGAAFAQILPEIMIKMRKAGYDFSAWNMGKIRAMVEYNPASFNKEQVVAAANAIAAIANSGMGELYGPGTDKDVGGQKTSVSGAPPAPAFCFHTAWVGSAPSPAGPSR